MTRSVETRYGKMKLSTGSVLDLREAIVSGGGRPSFNTLKLVIDEFDGKERHFSLSDWKTGIRTGNHLTTAWFIPKHRDEGPYIGLHNHDTEETEFQKVSFTPYQGALVILLLILSPILLFALPPIGLLAIGLGIIYLLHSKKRIRTVERTFREELEKEKRLVETHVVRIGARH